MDRHRCAVVANVGRQHTRVVIVGNERGRHVSRPLCGAASGSTALHHGDTGEAVTYASTRPDATDWPICCASTGSRRLDHYSIFMENNDRYLEACGAGERAGLYYTCINSHLTADELAYIVDNSESKVLITSSAKRDVAIRGARAAARG